MKKPAVRAEEVLFGAKPQKKILFPFVFEALSAAAIETRPMFGCVAVYLEGKILMALREKAEGDAGVWLATTHDHHASLLKEFPNMRSIGVLGESPTGWHNLPADGSDFESSALRACELILLGDPRIGKFQNLEPRAPRR